MNQYRSSAALVLSRTYVIFLITLSWEQFTHNLRPQTQTSGEAICSQGHRGSKNGPSLSVGPMMFAAANCRSQYANEERKEDERVE